MSRQTAKGTRFETQVAEYMRSRLHMPIERRAKCGAKDRGDLAGVGLQLCESALSPDLLACLVTG